MLDIYLIGTIINIFWQIFTILFVLYRFTSFFSIIYGFTKFCGKLVQGVVYVKNQISTYITKKKSFSYEPIITTESAFTRQSYLSRFKNYVYSFFGPATTSTEGELRARQGNSVGDYDLPIFTTRESMSNFPIHPLYDSNYSTYSNSKQLHKTRLSPQYENVSTQYESDFCETNSELHYGLNSEHEEGLDSNLLLESNYINNFLEKR